MARRIPRKPIVPHDRPFNVSSFPIICSNLMDIPSVATESMSGFPADGREALFADMITSGCKRLRGARGRQIERYENLDTLYFILTLFVVEPTVYRRSGPPRRRRRYGSRFIQYREDLWTQDVGI